MGRLALEDFGHAAGGFALAYEALDAVAAMLAQHGTTSFLATTVTASPQTTCRSAEGIARYIEANCFTWNNSARAEILGIHFEGPFISAARRGVHPPEWLALPSAELLDRFLSAARGKARILTLAPELPGAAPCIDAALKAGLVDNKVSRVSEKEYAIRFVRRAATH